jgi:hypothetical protein
MPVIYLSINTVFKFNCMSANQNIKDLITIGDKIRESYLKILITCKGNGLDI